MLAPERLAEAIARLTTWYAAQPEPRRTAYRAEELARATGMPRLHLSQALILAGWSRAGVWQRRAGRRLCRVWYSAPGHRVPRPPRGRPRFILEDVIPIRYL
jgi:hypothetical protein